MMLTLVGVCLLQSTASSRTTCGTGCLKVFTDNGSFLQSIASSWTTCGTVCLSALTCSLTMGVFCRVQRVRELCVVLSALTCSLTMGCCFCRVQRVRELRVVLAALTCSLTMGVFCRVQRVRGKLRVVLSVLLCSLTLVTHVGEMMLTLVGEIMFTMSVRCAYPCWWYDADLCRWDIALWKWLLLWMCSLTMRMQSTANSWTTCYTSYICSTLTALAAEYSEFVNYV